MILFLIQFLISSPVHAQVQAVNNANEYCSELQPETQRNGLPRALSVDVDAKCKDGTSASTDLCTMSASCTIVPPEVKALAQATYHKDFSQLSDFEKDTLMRNVIQLDFQNQQAFQMQQMKRENDLSIKTFGVDLSKTTVDQQTLLKNKLNAEDQQAGASAPSFTAMINWLPSTLVCGKKDLVVGSVTKRVCKRPDECRLPDKGINVKLAQFEPNFNFNQAKRIQTGEMKLFPVDDKGAIEPVPADAANSGKQ